MAKRLTNFEKCKKKVKVKIDKGEIKKTFRCTKDGKASKHGKHRCKTSEFAICQRLRKTKKVKRK